MTAYRHQGKFRKKLVSNTNQMNMNSHTHRINHAIHNALFLRDG
ncbi:hypothetical protein PM8797T_08799 [Gimesia maris DSM 8797]|nr:hypothetical protein PM8797T_08799 [Gimesia maris DSM 8797]